MRKGTEIRHLLRPSEETDQFSLGSEIIVDLNESEFLPERAAALRYRAANLLASHDSEDEDAVAAINRKFACNDYRSAAFHLNASLENRIKKQPIEWMAKATDRDIELFCQWNLRQTWRLTKAINRDKRKLVRHTLEKTHELTDLGVFPSTAIPAMEEATAFYHLQGVDSFHSAGSNFAGLCAPDTIFLANMYDHPIIKRGVSPQMKRTSFHEYLHGAGQNLGWYFHGIKNASPVVISIIEEAFVEHATTVAHVRSHKQPLVINPNDRQSGRYDGSVYRTNRTFLAATMAFTGIQWEQLSESYFLPRGDERGEFLREDVERKIGKFFGSLQGFFDFLVEHSNSTRNEQRVLTANKLKELTDPAAA